MTADSSSDDGSNKLRLTDILVFFGQFIDHDIAVTPVGSFARRNQPLFSVSFEKFLDELPISIPSDDPDFTSKSELPFERAVFARENNQEVSPRELINELTAFLDLSQVCLGNTSSEKVTAAQALGFLTLSAYFSCRCMVQQLLVHEPCEHSQVER